VREGVEHHEDVAGVVRVDYVTAGASRYIYDDRGRQGGLERGARFVIAGDQNADPFDGDSVTGAAQQLLELPQVVTSVTRDSDGAPDASQRQGGATLTHRGDPCFDTADFADTTPGNLRVHYVLPSRPLRIVDAAVFWPRPTTRCSAWSATSRSRRSTTEAT
jgi:3-phytase